MVIRVFEYDVLSVGMSSNGTCFEQRHFDYLAKMSPTKYFQIQHRSIRFLQYVGAIQAGDLTIEILPKIDRYNADTSLWRDWLIELLRYCKLLKIEHLGTAQLSLKHHSILELYYEFFLTEVEQILHRGLYFSYQSVSKNRRSLKGKLQFEQHLRKNWLHKERFFTRHDEYGYDNIFNQIIGATLQLLSTVSLSPKLRLRLNAARAKFPDLTNKYFQNTDFQYLKYSRQNQYYQNAIQIAQLLLLQNRPSLKAGKHQLLALLFDMNLLFEEYIFRQLCQLRSQNIRISRQEQSLFWNRQYLRPDIVLKIGENHYVIDTKWKVLKKNKPSMSDLQQAFTYGQYFDAKASILLYPKTHLIENLTPQSFQLQHQPTRVQCGLFFAEVIKNRQLNTDLSREIIDFLD